MHGQQREHAARLEQMPRYRYTLNCDEPVICTGRMQSAPDPLHPVAGPLRPKPVTRSVLLV